MIYYAIRRNDGLFLPNYGTRKGRGGWTNDEPQPHEKVVPRLFYSKQYAGAALREWLKGRQYQHINHNDYGDVEIRFVSKPERRPENMRIVKIELEVLDDPE